MSRMQHRTPEGGRRPGRPFGRILAFLITLAGLSIPGPSPVFADQGGYVIDRFETDLRVQSDSDLLVEERLEVEFSEPRHGIYRTIPVRYTDRLGYGYSLGFRLLEVTDGEGNPYRTRLSNQGRYIKIRIGDPHRTVRGRVTYVIRYRVRDALGSFPEHDELYWNATGHEWNTVIRHAAAVVHLPVDLPANSLQAAGYRGRYGGTGADVMVRYPAPGTVSFAVGGALAPLEGLTVAVGWPGGYVDFPGTATRLARLAADNWVALVPLLALVFLWRRYQQRGRDPAGPAAVMVRYEPPPDVTPGELGTLVDETVDLRDITAAVVHLAVRGYLTIRVEKKELLFGLVSQDEITFERRHDQPENALRPHERLILSGIFASGDVVAASDLKEEFYARIPGIKDALYERLTEKGFFAGKPSSVRARYVVLGVLAALLTAAAGILWARYRGGVFPLALVVPIGSAILTLLLFVLFSPAMPRRTRSGVRMRSWARGFEEFVDRVEKDRLDAAEARQAFEALLPYAMALGISSKWARKFEGIYADASPGWYVGPHYGHSFSTHGFEQSLSSSMASAGRHMVASPRSSSGSGGGGFSGGGGGGGGGGSW